MVVTIRSGAAAPDAVVGLWKEDLLQRVEVPPLTRNDVEKLLAEVLGAPFDESSIERLWNLTGGNALFLREVLQAAGEAGQLARSGAVWQWRGTFAPSARLRELVEIRLRSLGSVARRLVDALAISEPLGASLARELSSAAALVEAERSGVLDVEADGRRQQVRLTHPLYAEVVRAEMPSLHAREVRGELVDAFRRRGLRRRGDIMRQAVFQLEGDGEADADLLAVAAAQANSVMCWDVAERLARTAVLQDPGTYARVSLGSALYGLGRVVEADEVLTGAAAVARTDEERATAAIALSSTLFWGRSRASEAEAVVAAAEATINDRTLRSGMSALRALFTLFAGRPDAAVEIATPVLSLPTYPAAVIWASVSMTIAKSRCGRTEDALRANEKGWALIAEGQSEGPAMADHALLPLMYSEITALLAAGRPAQANARAAALYDEVGGRTLGMVKAVPCLLRGQAALAVGRPASAARWLREAATELVKNDPVGWLYWCLLALAEALALLGDGLGARRALTDARAARRATFVLWVPDADLTEAWVLAGVGEVSRAVSMAGRAARIAGEAGQNFVEALALHTAVRLDQPASVGARLRELTQACDSFLVGAFSDHADALAAGDGTKLDEVSARLQGAGASLLAAECAAQACAAHWQRGRRGSSWASAQRANDLVDACEGARTPALAHASAPLPLTAREREVAGLAARGFSNRAIAEQLILSVRTVEGHLDKVYSKLGLDGRHELTNILSSDRPGVWRSTGNPAPGSR